MEQLLFIIISITKFAWFFEHDNSFSSNQIREGQITREKALKLVEDENKPRYQNIVW